MKDSKGLRDWEIAVLSGRSFARPHCQAPDKGRYCMACILDCKYYNQPPKENVPDSVHDIPVATRP